MKKFSITNLETARLNPTAFAATLSDKPTPFNSRPKSVRWLDALSVYHTSGSSMKALDYLEMSFENRKKTKKNVLEVSQLQESLQNYFQEYTRRQYSYFTHKSRLEIILSSKVKLTGMIWLINSTSNGGYSSYTIVNNVDSWKTELRHPIIQNYISSNICKCNLEDVSVGVIDYSTGIYYQHTYSDEDVDIALEELNDIGYKISSVL